MVQQERQFVNSNMLGSMINSANTSSRSNFCNYCGKDNYTILKIVFERMDPIFSTNKGGRGGRGSYEHHEEEGSVVA